MIAAITLVIGGAPSVALASPCNPCPPDCAMMQAAAAKADDHAKAPAKQSQPDNPCKATLACAAAMAAPLPSEHVFALMLSPGVADLAMLTELAAPSRPPDRALRPPIQL